MCSHHSIVTQISVIVKHINCSVVTELEYDGTINTAFHGTKINFTPLLNYVSMPPGANTWYTDDEMLRGHVNHRLSCGPVVKAAVEKLFLNIGKALARVTRGKQAQAVQPQRLSGRASLGMMRQSELCV